MTKFSVLLSKTAEKELGGLDSKMQEKIRVELRELADNPFQPRPKADIKKLHKMSRHQFYRIRVGNYRIIYTIDNNDVKVTRIIPRGKGYGWLD